MTNFFVRIARGAEKVGETIAHDAPRLIPLAPIPQPLGTLAIDALALLPSKHEPTNKVENLVSLSKGETMNPLEGFAVTVILGILQSVVKNPAHAAAMKGLLVGVADDIYSTYGMVPPTQTTQSGTALAK